MILQCDGIDGRRTTRFTDRTVAGRLLARRLMHYARRPDVLVLALPRGGVPVAAEVARALRAPLDVFVVRKLGVPGARELAFGAIGPGGVRVLNQDVLHDAGLTDDDVAAVTSREQCELERREFAYRGDAPPVRLVGRTVILVDDGLATGATMRAAVVAARQAGAARVVVAVPLAPADVCESFAQEANEVVCLMTPRPFWAVGKWYDDFAQVTDEQVRDCLIHQLESRSEQDEVMS
jgi:predicted phosphoribosyltransferase